MILETLNKELTNIVADYAKELEIELSDQQKKLIEFEISEDGERADYSSSSPLKLAKIFKLNPIDIGEKIVGGLNQQEILKANLEGPGFINVHIRPEIKFEAMKEALKADSAWGKQNKTNKKVLVEFVSSNPTGPLHVGHGRGAVLGMAISNLLEAIGCDVSREYYVNDAGRQISILTCSIILNSYVKNFPTEGTYEGDYIKALSSEFVKDYGNLETELVFNNYDEDPDIRLDSITHQLKSENPKLWEAAKRFSVNKILEIIKTELHEFEIIHDTWFSESSLGSIEESSSDLNKSLSDIEAKDHTYRKEGAIWFKTTNFGDDKDRVLLRENNEPTYYLTDVGYHKNKIDRNFDLCINVFGADHHGYIPRLTAAFDVMKSEGQEIEFVLYQLVNLHEEGIKKSMSTRRGEFYSLADLRKELGPDVIKFFFLEKKSDHTMDFDLDLAKDESKNNPYFYAQYAYVRCCSILSKSEFDDNGPIDLDELNNHFELLSKMINFPHFIDSYAMERSPHSLVHFVKSFSSAFHSFYENNPVITDDITKSNTRLFITTMTKLILKNSFKILNVTPLERM
tara:strand:+ start:15059 stop:16768 length:1710 start_codon:yes stop_codon:yes gene_type:complete